MNIPPKSLRASSASSAPPRSPSCRRAVVVQIPPLSKIRCASPSQKSLSSPNLRNPLHLRKRNRKNDLRRCAKKPAYLPPKICAGAQTPTAHGSRPAAHEPPSPRENWKLNLENFLPIRVHLCPFVDRPRRIVAPSWFNPTSLKTHAHLGKLIRILGENRMFSEKLMSILDKNRTFRPNQCKIPRKISPVSSTLKFLPHGLRIAGLNRRTLFRKGLLMTQMKQLLLLGLGAGFLFAAAGCVAATDTGEGPPSVAVARSDRRAHV